MYKLTKKLFDYSPEYVVRLSDMTFIPLNEENADYREYLKWIEEGNEPLPADE